MPDPLSDIVLTQVALELFLQPALLVYSIRREAQQTADLIVCRHPGDDRQEAQAEKQAHSIFHGQKVSRRWLSGSQDQTPSVEPKSFRQQLPGKYAGLRKKWEVVGTASTILEPFGPIDASVE